MHKNILCILAIKRNNKKGKLSRGYTADKLPDGCLQKVVDIFQEISWGRFTLNAS